MQHRVRGGVTAIAIVLFLAACGGGGGGGSSSGGTGSVPIVSPTVTPTPTAAPTSGSSSINVSSAQATSAPLPAVGGFTGSIQLPPANANATLQLTVSTNPPAGARGVSARHPMAQTNTPYLYFLLASSSALTLQGTFGLTLALPSNVSPNQSFYLAALTPDGTWGTVAGPATVSGSTVTLSTSATIQYSGAADEALALAFYAGSVIYTGAPIVAIPSSITLMDLNATQELSIGGDPTATFTLDASQCKGIATATQSSATTYTIGAIGLGNCNLIINDDRGNSLAVFVSVTTTSVIIQ